MDFLIYPIVAAVWITSLGVVRLRDRRADR